MQIGNIRILFKIGIPVDTIATRNSYQRNFDYIRKTVALEEGLDQIENPNLVNV